MQDLATTSPADVAVVTEALGAVARQDWGRLSDLVHPDAVWTLPGASSVSGVASGRSAVIETARAIAAANLTSEPHQLMIGHHSVVATIRNTASLPVHLDEWLALVFIVRDGHITGIDTHLSDIPMLERFYAALDASG